MSDIAKVMEWFVGDDTGMSSKSIAAFMMGADPERVFLDSPPRDPSDLGRCLRLLELFPDWKARMPEMATIGKNWEKAVSNWQAAADVMADEVGIDWSKGRSAPFTYKFMKASGF